MWWIIGGVFYALFVILICRTLGFKDKKHIDITNLDSKGEINAHNDK